MMKFLTIISAIALLSIGANWMTVHAAETERSNCPGTIQCPLTGDEICADRCPV